MVTQEQGELRIPPEIIVRHKSGWLLRCLGWLGWLLAVVVLVIALVQRYQAAEYFNSERGIYEQYHSGNKQAEDKIAIITIAGVIQDGHGYVKRQIDRIRDDDSVKAVVVRINSPGGTVSGSDYIFHHLKKLRDERDLPIVVSMGPIAASGGYYVAMAVGDQEDSILAEPTTTTGSIGVIIPHYNVAGLIETYKIEDDSIMSHPRKDMLTISKRLTEDQRALLQEYVDESFERFKGIVLEGRPSFRSLNQSPLQPDAKIKIADKSSDRDLATGEVFTAAQAKKFGLVDRIGFLEDAIERAAEIAKLDIEQTRVVKYATPGVWFELPYLNQAPQGQFDVNSLFEMSTPRAYYLATTLPPLMNTWPNPESAPDYDP